MTREAKDSVVRPALAAAWSAVEPEQANVFSFFALDMRALIAGLIDKAIFNFGGHDLGFPSWFVECVRTQKPSTMWNPALISKVITIGGVVSSSINVDGFARPVRRSGFFIPVVFV